MKRIIIISLLLLIPASNLISSVILIGISSDKLMVRNYWENNDDKEHKLLILNTTGDTIIINATIYRLDRQTHDMVDPEQYFEMEAIPPFKSLVLGYPSAGSKGRILSFTVNGQDAGSVPLDMTKPAFDIPKNKVVTKGRDNIWFILDDVIVPYKEKIRFSMIMECRRNETAPNYLLLTQFRAIIKPKDGLVLKGNNDVLYETRIDFHEYEHDKKCHRRIDVILKDLKKSSNPFSPEFDYRVVDEVGNSRGGNVPLIIWTSE